MAIKKKDLSGLENHIALMTLYRDEWKHRDQMFVNYFWRFLYLSLVITFLPNFLQAININPDVTKILPTWIFSVAGIISSAFGLYLGLAENQRITNIDLAYKKILEDLPLEYRVKPIRKKAFSPRLNILLCVTSYSIIIMLAICNLMISIS